MAEESGSEIDVKYIDAITSCPINTKVRENIGGISVVKAFVTEEYEKTELSARCAGISVYSMDG